MSVTVVTDNLYQLFVAWSLSHLGALPYPIASSISIGGPALTPRVAEVSAAAGWRHVHVDCPPTFADQLLVADALTAPNSGPVPLQDVLRTTGHLIVFNDLHPCVAAIQSRCTGASVSLIEEGTGLYRSRGRGAADSPFPIGRQGEAAWIDELWVSQTASLSDVQLRKRLRTFDRRAVVAAIRQRWGQRPELSADARPLLVFAGQPFVEDGVLSRAQFDHVLDEIARAISPEMRTAGVLVYKPHPREVSPSQSAVRVLGPQAVLLEQALPLEAMDFAERKPFVLSLTTGAVRGLVEEWHCVSVAACFPELRQELGAASTYDGVTFLRRLGDLPGEFAAFLSERPAC